MRGAYVVSSDSGPVRLGIRVTSPEGCPVWSVLVLARAVGPGGTPI